MGETLRYQPLSRRDKISVVLYRAGIALSTVLISSGVISSFIGVSSDVLYNVLLFLLYAAAGLSVFFIHLYVSRFHRTLKGLYYLSLVGLAVLILAGRGDAASVIAGKPFGPLLLIPLSGCLGFVTAKEAFCFRLNEGYVIAILMPFYLLLLAAGSRSLAVPVLIALLLSFFTLRKVFMPMHYDIGDKSAYH